MIRVLFSRVKIQKVEKLFMGLHTSCKISHPDHVQAESRHRKQAREGRLL